MKKFQTVVTIALLTAIPLTGFAQILSQEQAPTQPLRFENLLSILNTLINWIFTILLILATFFIFLAAYYYLTAAGDETQLGKAKQTLIYALVGIGVALVAQGIRFLVQQLLQR